MVLVLNSIPKSGTHLVMRLLNLAGMTRDYSVPLNSWGCDLYPDRPKFTKDGVIVFDGVPFGDTVCGFVDKDTAKKRLEPLSTIPPENYLPGHHLWNEFSEKRFADLGAKMILIFRDPRSVAISHIHWVMDVRQKHPMFDYYWRVSLSDRLHCEFFGPPDLPLPRRFPWHIPLIDRYRNMARWAGYPRVHVTTFEALASPQTRRSEVERILKFVGRGTAELEKVISEMWGTSETYRKGQIDEWRAYEAHFPREADPDILEMLKIIRYPNRTRRNLSWWQRSLFRLSS